MRRSIIAFFLLAASLSQAATVELLQSTIVDNNALNFSSALANFNRNINGRTYQRFPMATSRGYQYATYYDENRNVCLGRRKLPEGAWEVIRFTDYNITSSDSHNVTALGICEGDGTIHLAFDHHAHPLNYRVSVLGAASDPDNVVWSTDLFSPVTDRLGSVGYISSVTYPTFFNAPNGNLMLYYRNGGSGNGDGMIQEYNGATHDWTTGLGKFIAREGNYTGAYSTSVSTSRCPYINGISYGGTRLHASWGWRETSVSAASNHDLNYAYSDDNGRTWYNSEGTQIGTTGSSFITVDSPGLIVADIPQNEGLSNQYTHYAFPDGSCHVMVVHNGKYQHYWRNTAGAWNHGTLSFVGSRPKLTGDDDGNLFLVYVSGGKPLIAKGVPNASKTAWTWSLVYTQNVSEGGEGHLDYSRWEKDRVLTFYGQEEAPDSNETPSPLHIYDYKVSYKAILPVPLNETTVPDVDAGLEWTAGIDAVSHRVYFGTSEAAVAAANTGSPEYKGQQSGTTYLPSPAPVDGATYYWRIDEVKAGSVVTKGLVWRFTIPPVAGAVVQVVDMDSWDEASTWNPAGIPVPGLDYETSLQLWTPSSTASFAGDSLTILPGGELVLMNAGSNTVTVPNLVLAGGDLAAGVADAGEARIDGAINVLSNALFSGAADDSRDLRILSLISGDATVEISAPSRTIYIDNAANLFDGTWLVSGGTAEFGGPAAVAWADIEVQHGTLRIPGDWDGFSTGASLTVADASGVLVDVGTNDWTVTWLVIGGVNVPAGLTYTVAELNTVGANPLFSGTGTIRVGPPSPPPPSGLILGWERWVGGAGSLSPATIETNGIAGIATNGGFSASKWAASTDGTFGSLPSPPASAVQDADEGVRLTGATDIYFDFAVENTSGTNVELKAFHFDALLKLDNTGPQQWILEVLSGDITVGGVATNALDYVQATSNLADYDVDLSGLADHILDAGGRAVFRLMFTGGTPGNGGYMDLDNVALTQVLPPVVSPGLEYTLRDGEIEFSWAGDGYKLQSRSSLTEGIWLDVPGGSASPVVVPAAKDAEFLRLIQQ